MSRNWLSIIRRTDAETTAAPSETRLASVLFPATPVAAPYPLQTDPLPNNLEQGPRARLGFAFDATSSREAAWATSAALTDALLTALPGQLDVNLAVHGGGRAHTFTPFESDAGKLRDVAAGIRCKSGFTRLLDILARYLETEGVCTIVYVGDMFEESERRARKIAKSLAARGIRLIILHEAPPFPHKSAAVFGEMAATTNGAVLPFDAQSLPKLRDLLSAVAVLTVGGTSLLEQKKETLPAARLLLEHLKGDKE